MRLTAMTDYSIRLLMYVGRHPDRLCTISEIAKAYAMSEPHLMKITHRLGQRGWIETVRGKHGGMRLAHAPQDIRLGAVIRDTENDLNLVDCFTAESTCPLTGDCRLTGIIDGALQHFLRHLDSFTLADILPQNPGPQDPVHVLHDWTEPPGRPAGQPGQRRPAAPKPLDDLRRPQHDRIPGAAQKTG